MVREKEEIPKECRTGDTCFTSLATIGGNLFSRHPKNINHVHKYSNYLLSVIITLGTNVNGVETVFNEITIYYIGKRENYIKNSHRRCVVGAFDKIVYEGSIRTVYGSVLSFILHKSIYIQYLHHGTKFYDRYIKSNCINIYIDDDKSGAKPK